jgi:hypothetical protein
MRLLAAAGLRGPASRQISIAAVPIGGPIKQVFGIWRVSRALRVADDQQPLARHPSRERRIHTAHCVLTAEDLS